MPAREAAILSSEEGGYSGPHLFPRTLALVRRYRAILDDHTPNPTPTAKRKVVFASGGITNGAEALQVLEAGADVVQIYTAMVYGGVGVVGRMKGEMRAAMRERLREGKGGKKLGEGTQENRAETRERGG